MDKGVIYWKRATWILLSIVIIILLFVIPSMIMPNIKYIKEFFKGNYDVSISGVITVILVGFVFGFLIGIFSSISSFYFNEKLVKRYIPEGGLSIFFKSLFITIISFLITATIFYLIFSGIGFFMISLFAPQKNEAIEPIVFFSFLFLFMFLSIIINEIISFKIRKNLSK